MGDVHPGSGSSAATNGDLQCEVESLRKTCAALKKRVAAGMGDAKSSFARFEHQAHLQRVVDERTEQIRQQVTRAQEENRHRARVEALLNDSQRLAKVGGWMYDIVNESMQVTSEFYRVLEIDPAQALSIGDTMSYFHEDLRVQVQAALDEAITNHTPFDIEGRSRTGAGKNVWLRVHARVYTEDGRASRILGLIGDITERKCVEARMAQSHKMESVGQLASGIAHEINTPTQFVSDNVRFLKSAFADVAKTVVALRDMLREAGTPGLGGKAEQALQAADWEFLEQEIPAAIEQSMEGLGRVAKLVRAMKDYAHPGSERKEFANLNRAIESTSTVARNEWKYVANLTFDPAVDLPEVPCYLADFNQVVLNMVVNAAHAIEERFGRSEQRLGQIHIATRRDGDYVVTTIADNGNGISEDMLPRIFDPFFTTKEVGKGTGQGLAISHQVIVKRHGGRIEVRSEVGRGTTMELWLPLLAAEGEP